MKIAVCISGFMRDWKRYFPQFQTNILNQLTPDVYFYGYSHPNTIDLNEFIKQFNFKKYRIHTFEGITKKIIDKYNTRLKKHNIRQEINIENMISMFRNIKKCNALINDKYDLVIRTRIDLYHNIIPLEILKKAHESLIYESRFSCKIVAPYAIADHFAIGTQASMNTYSEVYNHISKYVNEKNICIHPESLLGFHLQNNNINVEAVDDLYTIEDRNLRKIFFE